ncbi:hypothetical protein D3C81_2217270 [compost metagenome]
MVSDRKPISIRPYKVMDEASTAWAACAAFATTGARMAKATANPTTESARRGEYWVMLVFPWVCTSTR